MVHLGQFEVEHPFDWGPSKIDPNQMVIFGRFEVLEVSPESFC